MTPLEKKLTKCIDEGGEIFDLVKIAQEYNNDGLKDRVLDNIIKWGVEGIREKPSRIFYGDNTMVYDIDTCFEVASPTPPEWIGSDVGEIYDSWVSLFGALGLQSCADYVTARRNRNPIVAYDLVMQPSLVVFKDVKEKANQFRGAANLLRNVLSELNVKVGNEPICENEDGFVIVQPHAIRIIRIK